MKTEETGLLHGDSINAAPSTGSGGTLKLWSACILICQAAFLFGYDSAVLNGPTTPHTNAQNETITDIHFLPSLTLTTHETELATGLALVGAMIGAFGVNIPVDLLGRKKVLVANNFFYALGTLLCTFCVSFVMLCIGRFIVGVGIGVASVVVPQLLGEIAPTPLRGAVTSMNQLAVTLGILITNVIYIAFGKVPNGWQYTIGLALVPIVIQLIGIFSIPESPHWLVQRGRSEEAGLLLTRLRPVNWNVGLEIEEIEEALQQASANQGTWVELFSYKRVIIIGAGAMFFQQLTGINAVMYYSQMIFTFAGVENKAAATIGVTALNVGMTVVSVWLIDRVGKKPLLLGGVSLMTLSLTIAGVALIAMNNVAGKSQGTLCVIMVLLFVAGFAIGLGAALWPILSEIFPNDIRSKGMSFCLALNWTFNLILTLFVLSLINFFGHFYVDTDPLNEGKYGAGWVFIVFAGLSILALAFVYFLIPETKGKSFEEVQRILKGEKPSEDGEQHHHR